MPSATPQPSFIPHDAKQVQGRGSGGLAELLMLIGIVLLVASAALAGGVFLYQQYLTSSNAGKLDQLQRAEAAFEPSLVQQLQRLDDRMTAAGSLLESHLAPLALFSMLEQTTISSIQFTSLKFDASDPQHISLRMSGVADSVNSVALQSDLFSKSGAIQSPIFSNIDRQQDGVHFDFSSFVNAASLNYAQLLSGQSSSNQLPTQSMDQNVAPQGPDTSGSSAQGGGNPNPFGGTSSASAQTASSTTQ
jgi:hypothetical protein